MSTLPTLPLPIQVMLRAPSKPGRREYRPVAGAYCLLDTDGSIGKKPDPSSTWEAQGRTDAEGILVTGSSPGALGALFDSPAPASWRPHWARPVLVPVSPKNRFNLFWTRDRMVFEQMKKEGPVHGASLNRCRGLLYDYEALHLSGLYQAVFSRLLASGQLTLPKDENGRSVLTAQAYAAWLKKTYGFHAGGTEYPPTLIHLSTKVAKKKTAAASKEGAVSLVPYLDLEDHDLEWALKLADRIEEAAQAPTKQGLYDDLAQIECVLRLLRAYKQKVANDEGDWVNTIRARHLGYEEDDQLYTKGRKKIEQAIGRTRRHIITCGELLLQLLPSALEQLAAHYPASVAARYGDRLLGAACMHLGDKLWTDFLGSDQAYARMLKATKGKPAPSMSTGQPVHETVAAALNFYTKDLKGVQKSIGLAKKTNVGSMASLTRWLELTVVAKWKTAPPAKLADALNRANHWMGVLEGTADIEGKVATVVSLDGRTTLTVKLKDVDGLRKEITLRSRLKTVGKVAGGIDSCVKGINFLIAMHELRSNATFKNMLKAAKSTAEVSALFLQAGEELKGAAKVTAEVLKRFAGGITCIVGVMDALEKNKQGNNVAALGHLFEATGGLIVVLTKGGAAGWVAAGITLTGVVIVYFSLNDEEKYLLALEKSRFFTHVEEGPRFLFLSGKDYVVPPARAYLKHTDRLPPST